MARCAFSVILLCGLVAGCGGGGGDSSGGGGPIPAPTVTAVDPALGLEAGGTQVTVRGTNFRGATEVTFGGVPWTRTSIPSTTKMVGTAPAGSGIVDVVVSNGTGLDLEGLPVPAAGTEVKPAGEEPTAAWLLAEFNFDLKGTVILE